MRLASLVSLSLCVLGCERSPSSAPEQPAAVTSAASTSSNEPQKFGEAITLTVRQDLKQVLSAPEAYAGKTVLVEGHVRKACLGGFPQCPPRTSCFVGETCGTYQVLPIRGLQADAQVSVVR